jgi:hypothetical protein
LVSGVAVQIAGEDVSAKSITHECVYGAARDSLSV